MIFRHIVEISEHDVMTYIFSFFSAHCNGDVEDMYSTQFDFSFDANQMSRKINVIQFVCVSLLVRSLFPQGLENWSRLENWSSKTGVRSSNLR